MKNDWNRVVSNHTKHESQSNLFHDMKVHNSSSLDFPEEIYEKSYSIQELRMLFLENDCDILTQNLYNIPKADLMSMWRRFLENCMSLCRFYIINQAENNECILKNNKLWLLLYRNMPLREKDTKAFQIFNQADHMLVDEAYLLTERFDYENECNETGKRLWLLKNRSNILRRILRLQIMNVKARIKNWTTIAIATKQYFRRQSREQMVNDYRNEQMS
jgi:hypothetical protein